MGPSRRSSVLEHLKSNNKSICCRSQSINIKIILLGKIRFGTSARPSRKSSRRSRRRRPKISKNTKQPSNATSSVAARPNSLPHAWPNFAGDYDVQIRNAGRLCGHCCECFRLLTDPRSLEIGIGPECVQKVVWISPHGEFVRMIDAIADGRIAAVNGGLRWVGGRP